MKQTQLLLLMVCLLSTLCFAQTDTLPCNVADRDTTEIQNLPWFGNNDYLESFLDSIGYPGANSRIIDAIQVKYHVPVKFWIYRNSAGVGGPNMNQLQTYIDNLNRAFNVDNQTRIGFYMKCDVSYIDDDDHTFIRDAEAVLLANAHREPGCLNIHVTDGLGGDALGVHYNASFLGESVFLNSRTYTDNNNFGSTIAHEVGHFFGLDHTHQYANKGRCLREAIDRNRTWPLFTACSFVAGNISNKKICEFTGDLLSDTPAEHELDANDACTYIVTGRTDTWGDSYNNPPAGSLPPNPLNLMNYNRRRSCRTVFTRLQIAVMLHSIVRGSHSLLQTAWKDAKGEYDEYEMDNFFQTARIILFGERQERNFHQQYIGDNNWTQCDVDWVRFVPACNATLNLTTSAITGRQNANTRLTLFNSSLTQLAQNDDISSSNTFSSLSWNFALGQEYFIRIENMAPGSTSYYALQLGPSAQITGNGAVACATTYTVSPVFGATYVWSTSANLTINGPNTGTSVQVTPNTVGGSGWVQVTITTACGEFTVRTAVAVPDYGEAVLYNEDINIQVLHPSEWNVGAYRWYMDGVFFKQTNAPLLKTTLVNQCHYWSVSFVTDCGESAETYPIDIGCGNRAPVSEYSVNPNPVQNDLITVSRASKSATTTPETVRIFLYDFQTGGIMRQWKFDNMPDPQTLNVSGLKKGQYILVITRGQYRQSQQMIIE